MRKRSIGIIATAIIVLILSISAAAYVNHNDSQPNTNNTTNPANNTPTPTTTESTTTLKPSISPTPSPSLITTNAPSISPAPICLLPDAVKINYQESGRSYNKDTNKTQITLQIEVISDFTTRRTFILFERSFYLKTNNQQLSTMDSNAAEEILLNEDRKQTTAITFNITGNYTGSSYELTYNNPPDLLFVWKKL
jgi:DNA mismatch repair ATPase MutL